MFVKPELKTPENHPHILQLVHCELGYGISLRYDRRAKDPLNETLLLRALWERWCGF
jgi:hypothetical protein